MPAKAKTPADVPNDLAPRVRAAPSGASLRDARMVKSDTALREALLRLLGRKPFDQITVREIAAEAQVHYATFFRHHPSKEALLDHVASDQIVRLVGLALPVQEAEDYHAGFVVLCTYVEAHRRLWTALLTGGAARTMRDELLRVSLDVMRDVETPDLWLPADLATACTVDLILNTIVWWLRQDAGAYQPAAIAAILCRLMDAHRLIGGDGS